MRTVTHYWRSHPGNEQVRAHKMQLPFTVSHQHELNNTSPSPHDSKWPTNGLPLARCAALELVNKWNRWSEGYHYWVEV